ncbi:MAG: hypothetical protein WC044_14820 [Crocinitomicaceae bacterium]
MKSIIILVINSVFFSNCIGQNDKLNQSIYLFKDKNGIYLYNPETKKEELIFKASNTQVFLDEPYSLFNDTLTFGIKGEREFLQTSTTESGGERYFNDYYSVDLRTGKNWLTKKVVYEVIGHSKLNVKILQYSSNNNSTLIADTTMIYKGSSGSYKGTTYNNFKPRFYTNQTLGTKSVFSYRGSIYYVDKLDTILLAKNPGNFNSKTGSGFFEPQIAPSSENVIFCYYPSLWETNEKPSLQKVNIKTMKIDILKTGYFNNPTFSKDERYILFSRNEKEGNLDTWQSDIYIIDLESLQEEKISEAFSGQWELK